MARGRKPKPVEQKRREGNPGRRPLPAPVVVAGRAPDNLVAPDDLSPDARDAWDRIVPTLSQVGILDGIDSMALEAMCTQWGRAKEAKRVVQEYGHAALGSTGQIVEHPALATERAAHQVFLRFAEQYALTPVARTRLGLAELQRRSISAELEDQLGKPKLKRVK